MAHLVVMFPDRFFLVDGEKHIKCIEICILDLKYPKSKKMMSIVEGSESPGGSTAVTFEFDLQAKFVIWHLYIRQRQFSKFAAKLKTPQLKN